MGAAGYVEELLGVRGLSLIHIYDNYSQTETFGFAGRDRESVSALFFWGM